MVKRIQHIGPFLRNEMGVSLRGMSPMCDHSSIHLSENLFLKVYSQCAKSQNSSLRCGKVILVSGPCADVRQANAATALAQKEAAAR
jgi:hypothetical protein